MGYKDGKVQLKRADNQKIVNVGIERFSPSDRKLIQDWAPCTFDRRPVRAGDKVVTGHLIAVRVGEKVIATVDADVELVVAEVQDPWIGVVVPQQGRDMTGWIRASELRRRTLDGERHVADHGHEYAVPDMAAITPVSPTLSTRCPVEHLNEADFEQQVLKSDVPVLVDFYAEWCGPCKALGPVLEELAVEASDVKVVKVDIDRNRNLAARYGIQSLPSLLVFKNGQVRNRQVGLAAKARLKSMLNL